MKKGFLLMLAVLLLLGGVLYLTPTLAAGPYQAESATLGGGVTVDTNHTGYTGSGFVNFPANGGYVEFRSVDGGAGGSGMLKIRYALGSSSSRTGQLTVNGASQNITFSPTGAWNAWINKEVVTTLNSGTTNTIRLTSTGQDLANLDQMTADPMSPSPTITFHISPTPSPSITPTQQTCDQPAYTTSISVEPTSLQVGETLQVSFATNLGIPTITLYADDDVIATCTGNCQGSGLTIVNESPVLQMISSSYPFEIEAIAEGTVNLRVSARGESVEYRYDPNAGACTVYGRPWITVNSDLAPVSVSSTLPTITPTFSACQVTPVPPVALISADPTALGGGETIDVSFRSIGLGMPQYTLYADNDRIAVFQYSGGVDVYNESPFVRFVSRDIDSVTLEAIAPGATSLKVSVNGEIGRWMIVDGQCIAYFNFVTILSSPVSVSISGTPDATDTPRPPTCSVSYASQNDWGSGATVNVTVRNNSTSAINGWTLAWTFPGNQQITNLWNGSYSHSGPSVSVSNAAWNATIGANGGTVSFGFNLAYSGSNVAPAGFSLNGVACQ